MPITKTQALLAKHNELRHTRPCDRKGCCGARSSLRDATIFVCFLVVRCALKQSIYVSAQIAASTSPSVLVGQLAGQQFAVSNATAHEAPSAIINLYGRLGGGAAAAAAALAP